MSIVDTDTNQTKLPNLKACERHKKTRAAMPGGFRTT